MTEPNPFWKGRLFNASAIDQPYREYQTRSERFGPLVGFTLETLPHEAEIELARQLYPQAADDLSFWKESWDLSFPGWDRPAEVLEVVPLSDRIAAFLESPAHPNDAYRALLLERDAVTPSHGGTTPDPDQPAGHLLAETLRSARAFRAAANAGPYTTAVRYADGSGRCLFAILGPAHGTHHVALFGAKSARWDSRIDDDVLSVLDRMMTSPRADFPFWEWPCLRPFLGRTVFGVTAFEEELTSRMHDHREDEGRSVPMAGAMADLALGKERYALVTPHEVNGVPNRPQAIHIDGVSSIGEALDLLRASFPATYAATVEEWRPYVNARRYFFHGGILIGASSPCGDSHPYDGREDASASGFRDGWYSDIERDNAPRNSYATKVAEVLTANGIFDFAVDIAETIQEESSSWVFVVLAVMELWSADTLGFDPVTLADKLRPERDDLMKRLTDRLNLAMEDIGPPSTRTPFWAVIDLYGRDALLAAVAGRFRSGVLGSIEKAVDEIVEDVVACLIEYMSDRRPDLVTAPALDEDDVDRWLLLAQYVPFARWMEEHEEEIALILDNYAVGGP